MLGVIGSGILGGLIVVLFLHPAESVLGDNVGLVATGVIAVAAVLLGVLLVNRLDHTG